MLNMHHHHMQWGYLKNNWRNKIKRTKAQQNLNKICTCNLTDICINGLVMYFTKAAAIKQLSVRNLGLQFLHIIPQVLKQLSTILFCQFAKVTSTMVTRTRCHLFSSQNTWTYNICVQAQLFHQWSQWCNRTFEMYQEIAVNICINKNIQITFHIFAV